MKQNKIIKIKVQIRKLIFWIGINILRINNNIAVTLTSFKNEEDKYAFISSNNKSVIENIYNLSKNKVNKRTLNIGL